MWGACSYPLFWSGITSPVMDNLMYGGRGLIPCLINKNFEFMRGDVRDASAMESALQGVDLVIHLAAIVGYPACKKHPELAQTVNFEATKLLAQTRSKDIPILFGSTGSNYGAIVGEICTEETPLNPALFTVRQRQKPRSCCWIVVMSSATASPRFSVHPTGCASTCL